MPKLWTDTIEAHRRQVRDAIMETTADLAREHGPLNLSMTQVAEATGIGRATLYRYFDGIEAILHAWHGRRVDEHLAVLGELADGHGAPLERLERVLGAYATTQRARGHQHGTPHDDLAAFLHRDADIAPAERQLHGLVRDLVDAAVDAGQVRSDVPPAELATFCLHALNAAGALGSTAAVARLVEVTVAGLRPVA